MDEPPQEAPNGSLNYEDTVQPSNNQKTYIEGVSGQAPHKGSEHTGAGLSEQTSDKASNQAANEGSEQTDQRTSEDASQLSEHRRTSQQVDRRSSGYTERKTSEPPNQQLPNLLEGKASEKIDDRVSLLSGEAFEQTEGTSEHGGQTPSDQADYTTSGRSQHQVYDEADFLPEDYLGFSEDEERNYARLVHEAEKQTDYRSYYKTLAQAENRSLSETGDDKEVKEADLKIQPCTFEDSQEELRSKVSTAGETESAATIQAYNPPDTEFISDSQSSYEKLPSITTKVYYSSSQEKYQTTEVTTDIVTEFEQRKSSQRYSQTYGRRFPPIVYEDPYQVALRYMEKHNILQIFQITENLVYEKPDDPLSFMLGQVQDMIRYREERRGI
ncbi:testis-specific expressed protein 55 isoform X2 [Mesocricetus auratus]|uniref:Testis-specific expressed protein 55 isoform X2 n=1 Tax=Mesocricetus auratus TaxID=10036 RepID=A0ABM2XYQ0_MESAU|nr:testis-specific expressed protein 55 isoform X2 [Mesocricetus auratus]